MGKEKERSNREVKSRFMTSLNGADRDGANDVAEISDNCGLWAPWLISATVVYWSN